MKILAWLLPLIGMDRSVSPTLNWGHLFLFMVVMIPAMAILTRMLAWIFGKKKKVESEASGIEWVDEKIGKPFRSYEEYREALMGSGDLGEFLERCRAGVPPRTPDPAREVHRTLACVQCRASGIESTLLFSPDGKHRCPKCCNLGGL